MGFGIYRVIRLDVSGPTVASAWDEGQSFQRQELPASYGNGLVRVVDLKDRDPGASLS